MGISQSLPARQLTAEQALTRAISQSGKAMRMNVPSSGSQLALAYAVKTDGIASVYVFNRTGGGFYVLSGSDNAPAILGYSDNGTIDPATMPPAFKDWLEIYGKDIYNGEKNKCPVIFAPLDPNMKSVAPIIKTKWNQDAPYNSMCPDLFGYKTYTGCVATAMAQVMKSHEWPLQGSGSNKYEWQEGDTLSLDFSKIKFDWANMLDSYSGEYTQKQADAVATLMYAAGVSSDMNYTTKGSGTTSWKAGRAFINNFGYDKSLQYLMRDYYHLPEWTKMVYGELDSGRAVYYSGSNAEIGHAFILDGYDSSTGFFHVNWGWGGSSDGYYSMITLDPGSSQGIGGSTEGYYGSQGAMIGLKKAESTGEFKTLWYSTGDFATSKSVVERDSTSVVTFFSGSSAQGIYNFGFSSSNIDFGVKLQASPDSIVYVWSDVYRNLNVDPYYGYRQPTISSTLFPATGVYKMTPVYRSNGEIYEMRMPINRCQAVSVECSETTLKFKQIPMEYNIKGSEVKLEAPYYAGKTIKGTAKLQNLGEEYFGWIYGVFIRNGSIVSAIAFNYVDLLKDENLEISFKNKFSTSLSGDYTFALSLPDGTLISEPFAINVSPLPAGEPTISLKSYAFPENKGGNGDADDPYLLLTSPLQATASINCSAGVFAYPLAFSIYNLDQSLAGYIHGEDVLIDKGETKTVNYSGDISSKVNLGELYFGTFDYVKGNYLYRISRYQFIYLKFVGRQSGIEEVSLGNTDPFGFKIERDFISITSTDGVKSVEIYNLSGIRVLNEYFTDKPLSVDMSTSSLQAGQYIVRVNTSDKCFTRKMIKR